MLKSPAHVPESNIPHRFRTAFTTSQLITSEALNLCAVSILPVTLRHAHFQLILKARRRPLKGGREPQTLPEEAFLPFSSHTTGDNLKVKVNHCPEMLVFISTGKKLNNQTHIYGHFKEFELQKSFSL